MRTKTSQNITKHHKVKGRDEEFQGTDRVVIERLGGEVSLYSRSNVNHVIREHLAVLSVGILKPNSKPFFRYCDRPLNCHVGLPSGMTPC